MMKTKRVIATILLLFIVAVVLTDCGANKAEAVVPVDAMIFNSPVVNTDAVETVWNILREKFTETASAAIIGNLAYESGLYPYRVEGSNLENSEKLSALYVKNLNTFIYAWHGYGLASWTGSTNHKRLAEWCDDNGYSIDSLEGQVRFLLEDYEYMAPNSCKRINCYEPEDIVAASEDFRQSYEKSHVTDSSQWGRVRYAKSVYLNFGDEDYYDVVLDAPYYFDIYVKVNELNAELGLKRKGEN